MYSIVWKCLVLSSYHAALGQQCDVMLSGRLVL
jgi:hypothetical protein